MRADRFAAERFYEFSIGALHSARCGRSFAFYSKDPTYAERVARRYLRLFARKAAAQVRRGTMAWAENAGWTEKPRLVVLSRSVDSAGVIRCEDPTIHVDEPIEPLCADED